MALDNSIGSVSIRALPFMKLVLIQFSSMFYFCSKITIGDHYNDFSHLPMVINWNLICNYDHNKGIFFEDSHI